MAAQSFILIYSFIYASFHAFWIPYSVLIYIFYVCRLSLALSCSDSFSNCWIFMRCCVSVSMCVAMVNTYAHFYFNRIKLNNTRPTDHYGVQQHESRLDFKINEILHQIVQCMHTMVSVRVCIQGMHAWCAPQFPQFTRILCSSCWWSSMQQMTEMCCLFNKITRLHTKIYIYSCGKTYTARNAQRIRT